MNATKQAPHLYLFDRRTNSYQDCGPSTRLDRFLANFSGGQVTTRPIPGIPIRPPTKDTFDATPTPAKNPYC